MRGVTIIFKNGRSVSILADLPKLLSTIDETAAKAPNAERNNIIFEGHALININDIDCVIPSENVDK